ncbi:hypothetical protein FQN57_006770 [Myotisia sp. PD_48]|nr:hypothetical protein FQN57_006770 [Myotisia sp. PD_48]
MAKRATIVNTGIFFPRRRYSTMSFLSQLENKLTSRRLPLIHDYLSPQPSHLLNLSLSSFLTTGAQPSSADETQCRLSSISKPNRMPHGHHLVYFPPQVASPQLLPDGCDVLHSPGAPFNRRMWAGGSVEFFEESGPLLNGQRAVCVEGIRDVNIKGKEGDEKIFVGIERRIATVGEQEGDDEIRSRLWTESAEEQGDSIVIERRNLVFMRDRTAEEMEAVKVERASPRRPSKADTHYAVLLNPEFSHTLIPSRALLFRFSALTFNAHSIHLDRDYARNTEGYDDLLVHGPLSLTIMLSLFQSYVSGLNQTVSSIQYRNLAPLLVEREMKLCASRKASGDSNTWDIWIEGNTGGLAVKGTVQTHSIDAH